MYNYFFTFFGVALFVFSFSITSTSAQANLSHLDGEILLQLDSLGEAWYVHPETSQRFYLKDGETAYTLMRYFGLGILTSDLEQIPAVSSAQDAATFTSVCEENEVANRLKGKILLQVESVGEAWYVHPRNCSRVYLADGAAAYDVMRYVGLGITNQDLSQIATPVAIFSTTEGDFKVQLLPDESPITTDNFIKLALSGFYDGTHFHRVIPDFMIQGGDPNTKINPDDRSSHGRGGPGYTFDDEPNNLLHVQGVLSMANAGPNTNGSQFFIVTAETTDWLDGRHTIFGLVIEGGEVPGIIESVPTDSRDMPIEPVVLTSVSFVPST